MNYNTDLKSRSGLPLSSITIAKSLGFVDDSLNTSPELTEINSDKVNIKASLNNIEINKSSADGIIKCISNAEIEKDKLKNSKSSLILKDSDETPAAIGGMFRSASSSYENLNSFNNIYRNFDKQVTLNGKPITKRCPVFTITNKDDGEVISSDAHCDRGITKVKDKYIVGSINWYEDHRRYLLVSNNGYDWTAVDGVTPMLKTNLNYVEELNAVFAYGSDGLYWADADGDFSEWHCIGNLTEHYRGNVKYYKINGIIEPISGMDYDIESHSLFIGGNGDGGNNIARIDCSEAVKKYDNTLLTNAPWHYCRTVAESHVCPTEGGIAQFLMSFNLCVGYSPLFKKNIVVSYLRNGSRAHPFVPHLLYSADLGETWHVCYDENGKEVAGLDTEATKYINGAFYAGGLTNHQDDNGNFIREKNDNGSYKANTWTPVWRSEDGVHWKDVKHIKNSLYDFIKFNDYVIMACVDYGDTSYISKDGITWNKFTSPKDLFVKDENARLEDDYQIAWHSHCFPPTYHGCQGPDNTVITCGESGLRVTEIITKKTSNAFYTKIEEDAKAKQINDSIKFLQNNDISKQRADKKIIRSEISLQPVESLSVTFSDILSSEHLNPFTFEKINDQLIYSTYDADLSSAVIYKADHAEDSIEFKKIENPIKLTRADDKPRIYSISKLKENCLAINTNENDNTIIPKTWGSKSFALYITDFNFENIEKDEKWRWDVNGENQIQIFDSNLGNAKVSMFEDYLIKTDDSNVKYNKVLNNKLMTNIQTYNNVKGISSQYDFPELSLNTPDDKGRFPNDVKFKTANIFRLANLKPTFIGTAIVSQNGVDPKSNHRILYSTYALKAQGNTKFYKYETEILKYNQDFDYKPATDFWHYAKMEDGTLITWMIHSIWFDDVSKTIFGISLDTDHEGFYSSKDGATWTHIALADKLFDDNTPPVSLQDYGFVRYYDTIIACPLFSDGHMFYTADDGKSWNKLSNDLISGKMIICEKHNKLFISTTDGIKSFKINATSNFYTKDEVDARVYGIDNHFARTVAEPHVNDNTLEGAIFVPCGKGSKNEELFLKVFVGIHRDAPTAAFKPEIDVDTNIYYKNDKHEIVKYEVVPETTPDQSIEPAPETAPVVKQ